MPLLIPQWRSLALIIVALWLPFNSHAFVLTGPGWAAAQATFHTSPVSTSGSGLTSNALRDAFIGAMSEWTSATAFSYFPTNGSANPCSVPSSTNPANNNNGYTFGSSPCSNSFGATTLAIATTWRLGSNGDGPIIQSGIVFNSAQNWGIYNGDGTSGTGFDFRRVAVHELGHSLGLAHTTIAQAIMTTSIGSLEVPQNDDLNGAAALYGLPIVEQDTNITPVLMLLLE